MCVPLLFRHTFHVFLFSCIYKSKAGLLLALILSYPSPTKGTHVNLEMADSSTVCWQYVSKGGLAFYVLLCIYYNIISKNLLVVLGIMRSVLVFIISRPLNCHFVVYPLLDNSAHSNVLSFLSG